MAQISRADTPSRSSSGHHRSPANGRIPCAQPIGESHDRAAADVADRPQHVRHAEHGGGQAVDRAGVLDCLGGTAVTHAKRKPNPAIASPKATGRPREGPG